MPDPKTEYALAHAWASSALLRQLGYIDAADQIKRIVDSIEVGEPVPVRRTRTAKPAPEPKQSPVTAVHSFKIPRRGEITVGTELTVDGIRGRVRFVQACFNRDSGKEWIDVIHVRTGKARVIDPARIKTVHR